MLYVPRQQLRDHWETDNTRELVLYVPTNAMVRVTRAKEVVAADEAEDYEMVDTTHRDEARYSADVP